MIYFDNAATTRALDEVADKVKYMLLENFGNPSYRLAYSYSL